MRSNDLSKTIWKLLAALGEDTNLGAIKCILHGAAFFHGPDKGSISMLLFLRWVPDSLCFLVIAFPLHPEGSCFPLQGWHMKAQARTGSPPWLNTAEGKAVSLGRRPLGFLTHGWQTSRTTSEQECLSPHWNWHGPQKQWTSVFGGFSGQACLVASSISSAEGMVSQPQHHGHFGDR